jgi:hypothetical protein
MYSLKAQLLRQETPALGKAFPVSYANLSTPCTKGSKKRVVFILVSKKPIYTFTEGKFKLFSHSYSVSSDMSMRAKKKAKTSKYLLKIQSSSA